MSQRPLLITSLALTAVALLGAGALLGRSSAQPSAALPAELPPPPPEAPEPATTPVADPGPTEPIGPAAAGAAALAAVPGARLLGTPELVWFRGQAAYEASLDRGTVYVDAHSRRILHDGTRPPARAPKADRDEHDGQLAHAGSRRRHHHEHEEDDDEDD